jgi:hypothetical protein
MASVSKAQITIRPDGGVQVRVAADVMFSIEKVGRGAQ